MKYLLWGLVFLTVFIVWYTSPIGREWAKKQPWLQWYYKSPFAERVETTLFGKSETLLYNRFKALIAGVWSLILVIGGIDYSPFLIIIPPKYHWLIQAGPAMILALDGIFGEVLRRWTTKPLPQVALPEATPVPKGVEQAVERAEVAKDKATEAIEKAEEKGTM